MAKVRSYRELEIWRKAMIIVKKVYGVVESFPREEIYGLTSQMKRSVVSIPSNISEGFRRQHNKEFKQFLFVALGSSAEIETQLTIAKELGYITPSQEQEFLVELDRICRMISSLIKKL